MNRLMEKLFGKEEPLRVYITDQRTPEQEVMFQEQRRIKDALGMKHGNEPQNWLRRLTRVWNLCWCWAKWLTAICMWRHRLECRAKMLCG